MNRFLVTCLFLVMISQSTWGFFAAAEGVNLPSADLPEMGTLEVGTALTMRYQGELTESSANVDDAFFLRMSLTDYFQFSVQAFDSNRILTSFYTRWMNHYDETNNWYHRFGVGMMNLGIAKEGQQGYSTFDLVANYTFSVPSNNTNYTFGAGRNIESPDGSEWLFFAGFDQSFSFGTVILEYDGTGANIGWRHPMGSQSMYFVFSPDLGFDPGQKRRFFTFGVSLDTNFVDAIVDGLEARLRDRLEMPEVGPPITATPDLKALEDALLKKMEDKLYEQSEEPEKAPDESSLLKSALHHMQVGLELYYDGHFLQSLSEYDEVISILPDSPIGYIRRGSIYMQLGRYEDAIRDWEMGLKLEPDNSEIQRYIQEAKDQIGDVSESL